MLASSYQPPPLIRMMPRPVEQAAIPRPGWSCAEVATRGQASAIYAAESCSSCSRW